MLKAPVIRVVLADDHRILREGIRALLDSTMLPDGRRVLVAGQAADGPEAIALCGLLEPDVAVVDVSLPGISGFEVTQEVRHLSHPPSVVMLSMYSSLGHVKRAREVGAAAYVVKGSGVSELAGAIVAVADGELGPFPEFQPTTRLLSDQEHQILIAIARGLSDEEIALELGLSAPAVSFHRLALMKKLAVRDVASLTRVAIKLGVGD